MLCRRHRPGRHRRRHHHRPGPGRPAVTLRFGTQTDARPVRHAPDLPGTGRALSVQAVANYIAKYATKALDAPGIPDRPIRSALDLEALRCHPHYRRMITTAWRLGGGQLTPARPGCASGRTCSATAATSSPNPAATPPPSASSAAPAPSTADSNATPAANATPGAAPSTSTVVLVLHTWTYAGTGYTTTPGAELALASAAMARAHRQAATAA